MCNKNSCIKPRKVKTPPKPARKSRTKTRKPKYLSLKLQLSSPDHPRNNNKKPTKTMPFKQQHQHQQQQQLNLFPLHPENLVHQDPNFDKEIADDQVSDHVAFLFQTATDTSTSLHGILDSTTTSSEGSLYIGHESEERCGDGGGNDGGSSLIKTAMKCKERDASEERWVSYWDVVEKKEQEEVSSCCYAAADALEKLVQAQGDKIGLVGLKLDYQQILNAWSDKGPLCIPGESPQIVPDLLDSSNALMDGLGSLWAVPEMGKLEMKEKGWNLGQREASVLRYKEKRQSRLFAKRIRYEVRKLNAEKRPRLKGRFVKRNGEE